MHKLLGKRVSITVESKSICFSVERARKSPFSIPTLLIAVAIILPWQFTSHFPPWYSFHSETVAFLALAAIVIYNRNNKLNIDPQMQWILLGLVCFPVVVVFLRANVYLGDGLVTSIYIASSIMAWHQGAILAKESKSIHINILALLLLWTGILVFFQILVHALTIEQYFSGWVIDSLPGERPRANIGQPNHAATMLLMSTVSAVILRRYARIGKFTFILVIFCFVSAIALTQSRTAVLSAIVISGIYLFFKGLRRSHKIKPYEIFIWWLIWIAIEKLARIFIAAYFLNNAGSSRVLAATGTRLTLWNQLIDGFLHKIWFGFGSGGVPLAQQIGSINYPAGEQLAYAHNLFIEILVNVGIVPVVTIVLILIFSGKWQRLKKLDAAQTLGMILILPFSVHCMFEMPYAYLYFLIPVFFILGNLESSFSFQGRVISFRPPSRSCVVIFLIISLWAGKEYVEFEEDFRINRFANANIGPQDLGYEVPKIYLLTHLEDLGWAMRIRPSRKMSDLDLDRLSNISRRYTWAPLQYRAAVSLAMNGRAELAKERMLVIKNNFSRDIYMQGVSAIREQANAGYPELIPLGVIIN